MPTAVQTQAVIKTYPAGSGTINAVDEVTFDLETGQLLALVGPSGSGKTTLLAMLAGLLTPTSGYISIAGQDLSRMKDRARAAFRRRNIGFTFQSNNLVPYLTALENVELMLRLNREHKADGKRRARELLARLGLEGRMHSLPRQLSGGQQQRVAIARSLINQPTLVLADEPTASLDTERAIQVVQTLADLVHDEGRAGIMVTHDLRMVLYADRVIQMLDGSVARMLTDKADLACLADPENCESIPAEALGIGSAETGKGRPGLET